MAEENETPATEEKKPEEAGATGTGGEAAVEEKAKELEETGK